MSRPTSRPPFSALICSILFTSDLPSRRRRVNTKKAPLPLEEKGTLASLRVRHRTLRAREPHDSSGVPDPWQGAALENSSKPAPSERAPCLLAGLTWRKNQQRRVRCSIRRRRHGAFQQSSWRRRPPTPRLPPCPSLKEPSLEPPSHPRQEGTTASLIRIARSATRTLLGRATVPSPYLDSARKELRDRCGRGHLGAKLEPRGRRAPVVVRQQRIGSSLRAGFGSALFLRGGFGDAESDDQLRLQSYLVVILRAASGELVLSAGTFGLRRRGPP